MRIVSPWESAATLAREGSPWVRVADAWAGAGFGASRLPRVGQDVLVAFEDGDPDRPFVVGRVANAMTPSPYALPEKKTQSGWKSGSVPRSGGFNEVLFEDRKGQELFAITAERDARSLVRNDETQTIGNEPAKTVSGHEAETTLGQRFQATTGRREEITAGDVTSHVAGDRTSFVGKDREETVVHDRSTAVERDAELHDGGEARERYAAGVHVTAGASRVDQVGGTASLVTPIASVRARPWSR